MRTGRRVRSVHAGRPVGRDSFHAVFVLSLIASYGPIGGGLLRRKSRGPRTE